MANDGESHISISWSSLQAHTLCKQKSYLFASGHKNPSVDVRGFFHGRVVDQAMRKWLSSSNPLPGEMAAAIDGLMVECEEDSRESGDGIVRWRHVNDRRDVREFCVELVRRLEPILHKLVLPHEYEPAKRYKVPVEIPWLDGSPTTIYLKGEMDVLVRMEKSLWAIWDLKGTKDDSYWRKTLGQLLFYDISLEAMMGARASKLGLIQPMCKEPVLEFEFSEEDRSAMWQRIMRMASDLWQHDYEPKLDAKGCSVCPVRHACRKFTPVERNHKMSLPGMQLMQGSSLFDDLGVE